MTFIKENNLNGLLPPRNGAETAGTDTRYAQSESSSCRQKVFPPTRAEKGKRGGTIFMKARRFHGNGG